MAALLNHVKPLRWPQPKLLDQSILFSLFKLVFLSVASIYLSLLTNLWSRPRPLQQAHGYQAWVQNYIPAKCCARSTKIFLNSCRVFPSMPKSGKLNKGFCWLQGAVGLKQSCDNIIITSPWHLGCGSLQWEQCTNLH